MIIERTKEGPRVPEVKAEKKVAPVLNKKILIRLSTPMVQEHSLADIKKISRVNKATLYRYMQVRKKLICIYFQLVTVLCCILIWFILFRKKYTQEKIYPKS